MHKYLAYSLLTAIGFVLVSFAQFIFIITPSNIPLAHIPENFGLPREDVYFKTIDGILISGWLIEPPRADFSQRKDARAVILLHSYPFNKADLLTLARDLYPDFSFLLFDMRSFGKSGGRYTTFGIQERYDVSAAIQFLHKREYQKIGVFGYSLGGAVAIIAASENPDIRAVASYGAFADIITVGKESFHGLSVLADPFVQLFGVFARPLFGAWPQTLSPEHAAQKISIPILIIHAETDKEIPFAHALRLKDALIGNQNAQFYFPRTGSHGQLPGDIADKLSDFFFSSL